MEMGILFLFLTPRPPKGGVDFDIEVTTVTNTCIITT